MTMEEELEEPIFHMSAGKDKKIIARFQFIRNSVGGRIDGPDWLFLFIPLVYTMVPL